MTKKKGIWMILAVILLLLPVLAAVAVSGQTPTTPWGCEHPSPSIVISASRSQIPPDGVSTSEIKVVVLWPEESNITEGTLTGVLVDLFTTCGRLTDAENQSNSDSSISLTTDNNGAVTALLSGDKTGVAYITSTTPWACNKTTVTFVAPGAAPIEPSPIPTVPPLPDVATPTAEVTPSPTAEVTPSPTAEVTPEETEETQVSPVATTPGDTPGFEAVFAIAGLLVVAYSVLRRERKV